MLIDVRFRGLDMTTEEIDTTMREWSARAASASGPHLLFRT